MSRTRSGRVLYGATKGAVYALTLAMAADHLAEGIRVNCVSPGTVDTSWVGRLLENAEDPAAASAALRARQPLGRLVPADKATDAAVMDQMLRRLRPAMAPGQGRPMSLG
jgi:2-keto-3-deoxy-L-fuconate dehydrogenase